MNASTSPASRAVIVGGGIAGLSIAARLGQAGWAVTLLEASQLGFGASTRNQGWLYSGAWFALANPSLARQCYRSLKQTLFFCPECREPDQSGMLYLLAEDAGPSERWMNAWTEAGIPFEPLEARDVLKALPHWIPQKIQAAWRLPDRAIRTDQLLRRLANTAAERGVEIRTGSPVAGLLNTNGRVQGVITAAGEEVTGRLVILATGGEAALQSEAASGETSEDSEYKLAYLKTHLMAVEPGLCPQPFCVLDHQGFNHVPHASASIFGSNHWTITNRSQDVSVEPKEIERITGQLRRLLPTWDFSKAETVEWAGTTVQAMHRDQIEPGRATLPTVIDHETEPGGFKNVLSVFPGRASLWPQLAEMAMQVIETKRAAAVPDIARPPWLGGETA